MVEKVKISVRVKTNSKVEKVVDGGNNEYILQVKAPPHEGRANAAVIELLSDHFNVPKSRISIIRGFKGKNKLIEIKTFS